MDRRHASDELRDIRHSAQGQSVGEGTKRLRRAAERRAERGQENRMAPALKHFEEMSGHQASIECATITRRVEALPLLSAPFLQPSRRLTGKRACGDAVVPPPIVGPLEEVAPGIKTKPIDQRRSDLRVTVDFPEPRHQVKVGDRPGRPDAVADIIDLRIVTLQLERVEPAAKSCKVFEEYARCSGPTATGHRGRQARTQGQANLVPRY